MIKCKFGAWAVAFMLAAFTFSACVEDDDTIYEPPANIVEALKQLYPGAEHVKWEIEGDYYVADCRVSGDELDVWFNTKAEWVMTESELAGVDELLPAVYTTFRNSDYSSWDVTEVYVLTYPVHPTESVIQVKKGTQEYALYFSQEGGLLHEKNLTGWNGVNWPPALNW